LPDDAKVDRRRRVRPLTEEQAAERERKVEVRRINVERKAAGLKQIRGLNGPHAAEIHAKRAAKARERSPEQVFLTKEEKLGLTIRERIRLWKSKCAAMGVEPMQRIAMTKAELEMLAKSEAPDSLAVLVDMRDAPVRLVGAAAKITAAEALINRGYGKPTEFREDKSDLAILSSEELMALVARETNGLIIDGNVEPGDGSSGDSAPAQIAGKS